MSCVGGPATTSSGRVIPRPLQALPETQRQNSLLRLLTAFSRPERPVLGALAPAELLRKALQQNEVGADQDIPHLTRQLIDKYISDREADGLLPTR